ncbi:BgTH12-04684 [Blumeria graminis f. sp. triticale]|uniref:BgTH12-04684 n=1 Tax=Blumeria graminis f. sp. triticale TaxID=1689686 RepID=A0A9W4CUT2_BLUGR|nr:BgTH12-04684 [Blumeria graminis f. sp. triticale]
MGLSLKNLLSGAPTPTSPKTLGYRYDCSKPSSPPIKGSYPLVTKKSGNFHGAVVRPSTSSFATRRSSTAINPKTTLGQTSDEFSIFHSQTLDYRCASSYMDTENFKIVVPQRTQVICDKQNSPAVASNRDYHRPRNNDTTARSIFQFPSNLSFSRHSQTSRGLISRQRRPYIDLLEAHSTIKSSNDVFQNRLKATGVRNYGEDVANRNMGHGRGLSTEVRPKTSPSSSATSHKKPTRKFGLGDQGGSDSRPKTSFSTNDTPCRFHHNFSLGRSIDARKDLELPGNDAAHDATLPEIDCGHDSTIGPCSPNPIIPRYGQDRPHTAAASSGINQPNLRDHKDSVSLSGSIPAESPHIPKSHLATLNARCVDLSSAHRNKRPKRRIHSETDLHRIHVASNQIDLHNGPRSATSLPRFPRDNHLISNLNTDNFTQLLSIDEPNDLPKHKYSKHSEIFDNYVIPKFKNHGSRYFVNDQSCLDSKLPSHNRQDRILSIHKVQPVSAKNFTPRSADKNIQEVDIGYSPKIRLSGQEIELASSINSPWADKSASGSLSDRTVDYSTSSSYSCHEFTPIASHSIASNLNENHLPNELDTSAPTSGSDCSWPRRYDRTKHDIMEIVSGNEGRSEETTVGKSLSCAFPQLATGLQFPTISNEKYDLEAASSKNSLTRQSSILSSLLEFKEVDDDSMGSNRPRLRPDGEELLFRDDGYGPGLGGMLPGLCIVSPNLMHQVSICREATTSGVVV